MSRLAMPLLFLSVGMGLGRSLEEWPGPEWASGLALLLAGAALVAMVRSKP